MSDFVKQLKRAAKHNSTWRPAVIYAVAQDDGEAAFTASGEMQFDREDSTFGFVDLTAETDFTTAVSYEGNARVTVISDAAPNGVALILLEDTFYAVQSVVSADALQATVKYACTGLSETDAPIIRTA